MPITIRKFYKSTIWLDDEDSGEPTEVVLHVARLNPEQYEAFEAGMQRLNDPPSLRLLAGRNLNAADEQEKDPRDPKGERFLMPDAEIRDRRIRELDPHDRAAYDAADADDERWAKRFIQESIEQYISAPPGQIFRDDETCVTAGADIVRIYCGRADVLRALMMSIHGENTFSASAKKVWRSVSAFSTSLTEAPREVAGSRPAQAVANVATPDSVAIEDATASNAAPTDNPDPDPATLVSSGTPAT